MSRTSLDEIAANVAEIDLWQARDWPHRRGDDITLNLHSYPLDESSPGRRSHPCENCDAPCLCIHDNVLCWKCKSTFCLHCTALDPNSLLHIPMHRVLELGFGKCHTCQEPLRSIALVDVLRFMMEEMDKTNAFARGLQASCSSLVQEAEDALARGKRCRKRDPEQAILEYTHAINAINYVTSSSCGSRLVLRALDIFLIAHSLRAELEDDQALCEAIVAAYPKKSVRTAIDGEEEWFLSQSAYETLFYPLQANVMCGSRPQGGFVTIDQRSQSKDDSFKSEDLFKQLSVAGYSAASFLNPMFTSTHPHCDGIDASFDSLDGKMKGLLGYSLDTSIEGMSGPTPCTMGAHSFSFWGMVQFIRVFPTDLAAAEYTRNMIVTKQIGEEKGPLNAKHDPQLTSFIQRAAKDADVENLCRLHVIKSEGMVNGMIFGISIVASVGNVSTKIFIQVHDEGSIDNVACHLGTKALAYLSRQLQEHRTTDAALIPEAAHHPPDLTVCAYCGNDDEGLLKSCSRCKLSRYCGVDCQKKHFAMKGPFGHKPFCKNVVAVRNEGSPRTPAQAKRVGVAYLSVPGNS